MAGFDFKVRFRPKYESLVRALLVAAQRRAREFDLEWRFRRKVDHYYVTVDGSLRGMEVVALRLLDELPAVAEGYRLEAILPALRRYVAFDVLEAFANGLRGMQGLAREVARSLGGIAKTLHFDVPKEFTHLQGRIDAFTHALLLYYDGRLSPAQMVEEAHTTVEAVLRARFGRPASDDAFPVLISFAAEAGAVSATTRDELLHLQKARRGIKHRGQGIGAKRAQSLIEAAIVAVHGLLRAQK